MALIREALGRGSEEQRVYVDMLIYGRSGAGKTFEAATAPGPIYMISPDPTGHKSVPFKVEGIVVRTLDDLRNTITSLYEGGHGFKTLIIDGLSFIYDLFLKEVGQYFVDKMGAKDADLMPIAGRLKVKNQYKAFLRQAVDLTQVSPAENRVHVIFTTLEERVKESDEAPFQVRPLLGSKGINEEFPAFFSVIAYIEPIGGVDEQNRPILTRRMLFTEANGILARDRLGIFPLVGDAPNLSQYIN